jgi:uncharacterized protein
MPTDRLPIRFDPFHLAKKNTRLEGSVALKFMRRLDEASVTALEPDARVTLHMSTEVAGIVLLTGNIRARVMMQCQRCLKDMVLDIDRPIELALVRSDAEAVEIQAGFETYEVSNETIFTRDLIEDELLLSLPIIPMHHDSVHCDGAMLSYLGPQPEEQARAPDHSPFRVLKDLGKSRH